MHPRLSLSNRMEAGGGTDEPAVRVRLSEIADLLADAVYADRTWLQDFADDDIRVSADLYEVLLAYGRLRRSA